MIRPGFATTEAGGVQLQALHTLAGLGWSCVTRTEADSLRHGRLADTVLEDVLGNALRKLNSIEHRGRAYPLTDAAVAEAIGRLKAATIDTASGAQGTNAKATDLIRLGTSIDMTIEGETRGRQVRFVDWETPENNAFQMTAEYAVECTRGTGHRRPDIVLFVNGIPLVVIEVKKSADDASQGVSQSIRNQGNDEIPRLFATAQILIAANPHDPRYATAGTSAQFWGGWREQEFGEAMISRAVNAQLDPDEAARIFADFEPHRRRHERMMEDAGRIATPLDAMLAALCTPARLLELVRSYILVDDGVKKIARYQQYFGVRRALERLEQRDASETGAHRRRGGVIWHTQGSGKSLTMVMLADAIVRAIPNARLVLVTDRVDLDEQLRDTFRASGKTVEQARTGRHLIELIRARTDIITTIVDKFDSGLNADPRFRDDDTDVFLLVDESHRSQTVKSDESMHARMRRVFPGGCYIGFTGTPLLKAERSTFNRFGGLIHSYRIDEAVADKAVVPLLYEGRHVDMSADESALDRWFEQAVKGLSPDQVADLKRRMARGREVRGAEPWLREVALDVSEDYARNWQHTPYKAQLVAPSKRAAVLLHRLLNELGLVTSDVVISDDDERDGAEGVNAETDDVVRAHLATIKANHGGLKTYEKSVIRRFKGPGNPEIIIVVDKLLTGFDAPRNRILYLARPLQEHGLLQAIARVNRLFETEDDTKEDGRIVDYAGILGELDEALTNYSAFADYDEGDVAQALVSIREQTETLPDKHAALLDLFKGIGNAADQEAYERHLADTVVRHDFYDRLRAYAKALATAFSSEGFIRETSERQIGNYKADLKRFENLRRAVSHRYADTLSTKEIREHEARIRKLLDRHIDADGVIEIVPAVNIFDETAFKSAVEEATGSTASVADAIASATARTISERMEEDPIFYTRFGALVAQAIEEFRAGRLAEADYLTRVRDIRDQVVKQGASDDVPEGVRGDELASAAWRVANEVLAPIAGDQIEAISVDVGAALASIVRAHRRVGWQNDPDVENAIRNAMDDYLYDEIKGRRGLFGLDIETMDALIDRVVAIARRQLSE
ncbi:HsdR family type I site-specific deoxyribonuclease [Sphingomonas sp. ZT3P38]|uniref:type I restriction endonuclease subunit R n=1 Tax=Parasphingomonas zepuensis TaxID=3096161 RepID=UPI002FC8FCD5